MFCLPDSGTSRLSKRGFTAWGRASSFVAAFLIFSSRKPCFNKKEIRYSQQKKLSQKKSLCQFYYLLFDPQLNIVPRRFHEGSDQSFRQPVALCYARLRPSTRACATSSPARSCRLPHARPRAASRGSSSSSPCFLLTGVCRRGRGENHLSRHAGTLKNFRFSFHHSRVRIRDFVRRFLRAVPFHVFGCRWPSFAEFRRNVAFRNVVTSHGLARAPVRSGQSEV